MLRHKKIDLPVLLVEDETVSRSILENILTHEGYEVHSAENGKQALEIFNSRHFPVVMTDWLMPEMDGIQLCEAIRKKASRRYTYIIILTVMGKEKDLLRGLEAGADEYLTKPFSYAELKARLNSARRIIEFENVLHQRNERYRKVSVTDTLTGAYNRVYLTERLPTEIARAKRYNEPLSVIFVDIDHFKKVNDSFGHLVGDMVLQEFVSVLKREIREDVDWVTRFGGEEFLIILPETDEKAAWTMAERLRKSIEENESFLFDNNCLSITASFGVASITADSSDTERSFNTLIAHADKFLHEAKNRGRNIVAGSMEELTSA